ncbi:MAG: flippase-like domain-containing protein [Verrucomicrobia bacterium]|nr:flippase-like domain-containing protein [Verrucomicrobiota bacterium]
MRLADIAGVVGPRAQNLSRRRGLAVLVSLTLLGIILWRIHPERLIQVFSQLRTGPLLGAVACVFGAALLLAVRWRWMLELQGVHDGFLAAWRGVLVGNALSAALLGAVLGDVGKSAWYARRHDHAFSSVLLACGLDRFCGGLGLVLYTLVTVLAATTSGARIVGPWELKTRLLWTLLGVAVVTLIGSIWLFQRVRQRWPEQQAEFHRRIGAAWQTLRRRPGRLAGAVAVSFVANLLIGSTLACGLAAASPDPLPWRSLLWTFPTIGLAASLPFTFAGAGAREGAALAIWAWFGIPAPVAVAATLVTLLATLTGAIPGCLLFWQGDAPRR